MYSEVYYGNFSPLYHLGTGTKAFQAQFVYWGFGRVESLGSSGMGNEQGNQIWTVIHDQISSNPNLMLTYHCDTQLSPDSGH